MAFEFILILFCIVATKAEAPLYSVPPVPAKALLTKDIHASIISQSVPAVAYGAPFAKSLLTKVTDTSYDPNPQYSFAYSVEDYLTGDVKSQQEIRNGDIVQGSYSLLEPDGSKRIVDYTADSHNGFNAIVRKEAAKVVAPIVKYSPSAQLFQTAASALSYNTPVARYAPTYAQLVQAAPIMTYSAPIAKYATPAVAYGVPIAKYTTPAVTYGTQAVKYIAPTVNYDASIAKYTTPTLIYGTPTVKYATPITRQPVPAENYGLPIIKESTPAVVHELPIVKEPTSTAVYGPPIKNEPTPAVTYGPPIKKEPIPATTYGPPMTMYAATAPAKFLRPDEANKLMANAAFLYTQTTFPYSYEHRVQYTNPYFSYSY